MINDSALKARYNSAKAVAMIQAKRLVKQDTALKRKLALAGKTKHFCNEVRVRSIVLEETIAEAFDYERALWLYD